MFNQDLLLILYSTKYNYIRLINAEDEVYVSRKGMANLLNLHLGTIDKYIKEDRYNPVHTGRVFFRFSAIEEALRNCNRDRNFSTNKRKTYEKRLTN